MPARGLVRFAKWVAVGIVAVLPIAPVQAQLPAGFVDEPYVQGLRHASTLSVSPDGRLFVAERLKGTIRVVSEGKLEEKPYFAFADVLIAGEVDASGVFEPERGYHGGLLGIAFDPQFPKTPTVYAFYTYDGEGGFGVNRVSRLGGRDRGSSPTPILDQIPGSREHQSGRLEFGIDGNLFVTIGDQGVGHLAQNPTSLGGKILRIHGDGSIPEDNPFLQEPDFRPEIFAMGIRNSFGLAVNPVTGVLYESENGSTENDEVNLVGPSFNLGHPVCDGSCGQPEFTDPIFVWPTVIAPTGIVYYDGDTFPSEYDGNLFVASWLNGHIYRLRLSSSGNEVIEATLFFDNPGPIYDLRMGRDGALYYLSSPNLGAGGSEVRRIRFDQGSQPTLSYTGNSRPGKFVSLCIVGPPGALVEHMYSFDRLAEPVETPQGLLWLEEPVTRAVLGPTGRDGQLTFAFPIPIWVSESTIYHQALVSLGSWSVLTPLVAEPVYPLP